MAIYILGLACLIAGFGLGYLIRATSKHTNQPNNGTIFLDKNEYGDDRIIFALDLEYDEISRHDKIVFNVVKKS